MNNTPFQPCPICREGGFWPVSFIDPASGKVTKRVSDYHWRLCRNCGSSYPSFPIGRNELQRYWDQNRVEESTFRVTDEVWARRLSDGAAWGRRTYDFLSPCVKSKGRRFLDVGCGLGGTVAVFQEHGWDAHGVDPDPNTKPFHEKQGLQTRIGRFEDVPRESPFDVICIAHAIYFIEDPRNFVQQVRKALSQDGLFMILSTHLFSSMSIGRPGYAHTWYPTIGSLIYLLEQEGFEIIRSRSLKGSDMILAKVSGFKHPKGHPWKALIAHQTQCLRHKTIGRVLLLFQKGLRGFRKFWQNQQKSNTTSNGTIPSGKSCVK